MATTLHTPQRIHTGAFQRWPAAYPSSLINVWVSGAGRRFTLRPVLPADCALLGEFFARVSQATRYNRFHSAMRMLPVAMLETMTQVDYRRHLGLVITTALETGEAIVADARFVADEQGDAAEFAIAVDDQWQRMGLGARALHALKHAAGAAGFVHLHGSVLAANAAMLALTARCGFSRAADRSDRCLVQVRARVHDTACESAARAA
jgi:acetyltransferase